MRHNVSEQAFTLIELMTAISIIGLLATVSLPSYQKYKLSARSSEMVMFQKAIYDAQTVYHNQYGTFISIRSTTQAIAAAAIGAGTTMLVDGGDPSDSDYLKRWNQFGLLPVGTRTYMYISTFQGKFYADGTAAGSSDTWDRGPIDNPYYKPVAGVIYKLDSKGRGVACSGESATYTITPATFGVESAPARSYDWYSSSVAAKYGKSSGDCYTVATYGVYDSATGKVTRTPALHYTKVFN
ncbi:MAG: prepilin-type N-terminal cleavage/methylation domain-containing protein [Bdellovibrionota bacterium]